MGKSRGLTDFYRLLLPNMEGSTRTSCPTVILEGNSYLFAKLLRQNLKGKNSQNYKRAAFDPLMKAHHASTYGTKSFSVMSNHIADSETRPVSSSVFVTSQNSKSFFVSGS